MLSRAACLLHSLLFVSTETQLFLVAPWSITTIPSITSMALSWLHGFGMPRHHKTEGLEFVILFTMKWRFTTCHHFTMPTAAAFFFTYPSQAWSLPWSPTLQESVQNSMIILWHGLFCCFGFPTCWTMTIVNYRTKPPSSILITAHASNHLCRAAMTNIDLVWDLMPFSTCKILLIDTMLHQWSISGELQQVSIF